MTLCLKFSSDSVKDSASFVNTKTQKKFKKKIKKSFIISQAKQITSTTFSIAHRYISAAHYSIARLIKFNHGKRKAEDASIHIHIVDIIFKIIFLALEWRRSGEKGIYLMVMKSLGKFSNDIYDKFGNFIPNKKITWTCKKTNFTKFYKMTFAQLKQKVDNVLNFFFNNSDLKPQKHHRGNSPYAKDLPPLKTNIRNLKENPSNPSKENSLTHKICLLDAKNAPRIYSISKNRKENYENYLKLLKKIQKIDNLIKIFRSIMRLLGINGLYKEEIYINKGNKRQHLMITCKKPIKKLIIELLQHAKLATKCRNDTELDQLYEFLLKLCIKPIRMMLILRGKMILARAYRSGTLINKDRFKRLCRTGGKGLSREDRHKFLSEDHETIDVKEQSILLLKNLVKNTPFEKIFFLQKQIPETIQPQITLSKTKDISAEVEHRKNINCDFWEDFLLFCQKSLTSTDFKLLFSCKNISKVDFKDNTLYISTKSKFIKNDIEDRLAHRLDLRRYNRQIDVVILLDSSTKTVT